MDILMQNISFSYGKQRVLYNVDLEIKAGEIHALLGENGAGKSTLMNILGGSLHTKEGEGQIFVDGNEVKFMSPSASLTAGIGFIHQELNVINDLTVYENMFLTNLQTRRFFLDKETMKQKTAELFSQMGIDINPSAYVRDLDVSYKQITEICKAVMQNAKVIIMDEPTTSLTDEEIRHIFSIMRMLKEKGVAIVFISHKLNEVMEICDCYSVMRNGYMIESGNVADVTAKQLAEKLVGHSIGDELYVPKCEPQEEILRLENFSEGRAFRNISLSVHAGEVLGVTGLLGDGREEIFQTVIGYRKEKYTGKIIYCGHEFKPKNTEKSIKKGIAYLPRNRRENGIIADMSVIDNDTIVKFPQFCQRLLINKVQRLKEFLQQKEKFKIKVNDENASIVTLSGGNQQKIIFSKLFIVNPKCMILDNPTQGVDVGAKSEIYAIIQKVAESGTAIIVLSPEAQEIRRLCNRAVVLFHGNIEAVLEGEDINESNIMYYATGGSETKEKGVAG